MQWLIALIAAVSTLMASFFSGGEISGSTGGAVRVSYRDISTIGEIRSLALDCNAVKPMAYGPRISLNTLSVKEKKSAFVNLLLPSILIAEKKIELKRERLITLKEKTRKGAGLSESDSAFLHDLEERYRTDDPDELLQRLNTHPASIVLAQAAIETGWGSSRFFVEGNNSFGTWTWKGNGIKAAASDARLSRYASVLQSVEDYYYSINVGWAYDDFREKRGLTRNPLKLISYLENYSTLRGEYVNRLESIIKGNNLQAYDRCRIDDTLIS